MDKQKINIIAKDGAIIPTITVGIEDINKKGIVIISHGFGEHAGSYVELAEDLLKAGYASIIPDQRGHGQPPEGAKNWHGKTPGYQYFVEDIISLTKTVQEMAPDTPIALYGHSMGGNIVINTLLRTSPQQTSTYFCAVIESPWFGLYNPPGSFMVAVTKLLSIIMPNYRFNRELEHKKLSSDIERAGNYSRDPLYHGYISMRMLSGIINACDFAMENAEKLPISVYLAYANNDLIVCNKEIHKFAERAGDMVTIKEYASNHAIHNDEIRETYCNDVIAFMDKHIQSM